MDIPLVHLIITLEHTGGELPSPWLSSLKRLFPVAFRRAAGCADAVGECGGGPDCSCRTIFAQRLTSDQLARRRYQKPPLPFAFQIQEVEKREKVSRELGLVLFGEATSHLETFLRSLELLFPLHGGANSWQLQIRTIEAAAGDGGRTLLPTGGNRSAFASLPVLSFAELFSPLFTATTTITLELLTPLRLLHHGTPLRELPFSAIAGALFRRISSLAYYYGGEEMPHDFKWLAERSRGVICSSSALVWVNRGGGLLGVEGRVTYTGELEEFLPFLFLGSRLNLGKGAAYGMGRYRLLC